MAKFYYNGVLLPEIPADVLAEYPYAWIRKNSDGVTYDLICGKHVWYVKDSAVYTTASSYLWYTSILESENFTYRTGYSDHGNFGLDNGLLWSNHDIPEGSSTSTTIYLKGTEPVPEFPEEDEGENEDALYSIYESTLTDMADALREKTGKTDPIKVTDMASEIRGIGNMEDGFTVNFHDLDNVLLAKSTAKCGRYVAELPNHDYDGWRDSDGNDYTNRFPFTETTSGTVIDLFAWMANNDLVDMLYEAYEVDKTAYPYVALAYQSSWDLSLGSYAYISFLQSYRYPNDSYLFGTGLRGGGYSKDYTEEIVSHSNLTVNYFIEKKFSLSTLTDSEVASHGYICHTNFDISDWTKQAEYADRQMQYRLDE